MDDLRRMSSEMQRSSANSKSLSDDLLRPHGSFTDVYGGAPRSIFSHQLSAAGYFYDDIFCLPEKTAPLRRSGRNLPIFDIPSAKQSSNDRCSNRKSSFFSDIFSWEYSKRMMRSRLKTNSSSGISSEGLSPLRPTTSDDGYDDVSLLASKLRPINVKIKWNSVGSGDEDHQKQQKSPLFSNKLYNSDYENEHLDKLWGCPFQENTIDQTVDLEKLNLQASQNDDVQFNSPSSAVSSERNLQTSENFDEFRADNVGEDEVEDEDEDDLVGSYVIELDSCNRSEATTYESNDVDEAIAWAKETFQKHRSQEKESMAEECRISAPGKSASTTLVVNYCNIEDEKSIIDEKIRLWLTGKEADVRLLLSSLHHILWPNSGWMAIPLMNLVESSQVKKAYQKSVLCLHPDKLQQRGASVINKYVADKAFAALQDAWNASLDLSCR